VTGHKKRVDNVLQKGYELLEVSSSLRREKVELEEKLLSRRLELQKPLEEVSDLQENLDSAQSDIFSFQKQVNSGCSEKLALEHELRPIQSSLEGRDKDVEELRTEVSRQSDHYDDLWLVHGTLLEEAQKLCSKVITLK